MNLTGRSKDVDLVIGSVSGDLSLSTVREKIETLESEWKKLPQVEIPVVHRYSGGIYAREIIIPADTLLTGRIYKDDHFDVMVYGDVTVSSDDGLKRLQGFNIFPSKQGKKRAGYTHSETKWITFCSSKEMLNEEYLDHLTTETFIGLDSALEESKYISDSDIKKAFKSQRSFDMSNYDSFKKGYLVAKESQCFEDACRDDYLSVLDEYGFTHETALKHSEDMSDRVDIDQDRCKVDNSIISGMGLMSLVNFSTGDVIMKARVGGKRTQAGRFTNHSILPNSRMVMLSNGDIDLVAIKNIAQEEITCDYRDSLSLQIKKAG